MPFCSTHKEIYCSTAKTALKQWNEEGWYGFEPLEPASPQNVGRLPTFYTKM